MMEHYKPYGRKDKEGRIIIDLLNDHVILKASFIDLINNKEIELEAKENKRCHFYRDKDDDFIYHIRLDWEKGDEKDPTLDVQITDKKSGELLPTKNEEWHHTEKKFNKDLSRHIYNFKFNNYSAKYSTKTIHGLQKNSRWSIKFGKDHIIEYIEHAYIRFMDGEEKYHSLIDYLQKEIKYLTLKDEKFIVEMKRIILEIMRISNEVEEGWEPKSTDTYPMNKFSKEDFIKLYEGIKRNVDIN